MAVIYDASAGRLYPDQWPQCVPDEPAVNWAGLFGAAPGDDDEYGPWLTPRMAAMIYTQACYNVDTILRNWNDGRESPDLPRVARPFFKQSEEWRRNYCDCFVRIAMRLQKGLPPKPNCTGEEHAFHRIMEQIESLHGDGDFEEQFEEDELPVYPADEDFSNVRENAVEDDEYVTYLYEDGDHGYSDSDEDDGPVLGRAAIKKGKTDLINMMGIDTGHLHPSEWFHAFKIANFRDHLPNNAEVSERPNKKQKA